MRMQDVKDTIETLKQLLVSDAQSDRGNVLELLKLEILQAELMLKFCTMHPSNV